VIDGNDGKNASCAFDRPEKSASGHAALENPIALAQRE